MESYGGHTGYVRGGRDSKDYYSMGYCTVLLYEYAPLADIVLNVLDYSYSYSHLS